MKQISSLVFAGLMAIFFFGATASAAPISGIATALELTAQSARTATVHKAGYRLSYRKRYRVRRVYRHSYRRAYRTYRVYHPYSYYVVKKRRYKRRHGIYIRLY